MHDFGTGCSWYSKHELAGWNDQQQHDVILLPVDVVDQEDRQ